MESCDSNKLFRQLKLRRIRPSHAPAAARRPQPLHRNVWQLWQLAPGYCFFSTASLFSSVAITASNLRSFA